MSKQTIVTIISLIILAGLLGVGVLESKKEKLVLEEKQLTRLRTGADLYDFSWSPDGKKIVFTTHSLEENTIDIWTMSSDGNNQKKLTSSGYNTNPSWSPNGEKIVFASTKDNNTSVWIMNDDGTDQKQLPLDEMSSWNPSWSPDSKKIIYVLHKFFEPEAWIPSPYEIWITNNYGTENKQLIKDTRGKRNPLFSPDGNKIIFVATAVEMSSPEMYDVQEELWLMNGDGTNPKVVVKTDEIVESVVKATWTLNSKQIFAEFYGNNKHGLLVIDTEGSNEKKIIALGEDMRNFSLRPDGKKIVFARGGEVWIMNNNGTNQKILTKSLKGADNLSWGPDGKKIAFTKGGEIWTLKLK